MGGGTGGLRVLAAALALVAAGAVPAVGTTQAQPRTSNTELVGRLDPGAGPYGDVWVHGDVA